MEFSPDGKRFAGLTLDGITIYDSATLEKARMLVCICTLIKWPQIWLAIRVHASGGSCAQVGYITASTILQLLLVLAHQEDAVTSYQHDGPLCHCWLALLLGHGLARHIKLSNAVVLNTQVGGLDIKHAIALAWSPQCGIMQTFERPDREKGNQHKNLKVGRQTSTVHVP